MKIITLNLKHFKVLALDMPVRDACRAVKRRYRHKFMCDYDNFPVNHAQLYVNGNTDWYYSERNSAVGGARWPGG